MSEPWKWGDEGKPKPEYKEPTGRHLCCGMDAEMRPFADGDWVPYDDYAKLRMERIHDLNQIGGLQEENARLLSELADLKSTADRFKAEVERLDTGIKPEGCNDAVGRAVNVLLEKEKEIARLKAEVERLNDAITRGAIIPDAKPE